MFKGYVRGGGPMPDSRYCAPRPARYCATWERRAPVYVCPVYFIGRERHGTRPAERITIRERVYRGGGSSGRGRRVGRREPLLFPVRLQPQMNIRLLPAQCTRIHVGPPIPLIARYLPQPIDKRHKIERMILSFRKSRNSNTTLYRPLPSTRTDRCILMQMFDQRYKIESFNCVYISLRVYDFCTSRNVESGRGV